MAHSQTFRWDSTGVEKSDPQWLEPGVWRFQSVGATMTINSSLDDTVAFQLENGMDLALNSANVMRGGCWIEISAGGAGSCLFRKASDG